MCGFLIKYYASKNIYLQSETIQERNKHYKENNISDSANPGVWETCNVLWLSLLQTIYLSEW